jgi:hypothetical protein
MSSLRARHYAPVTPLDTEPIVGPYTEPKQREEAVDKSPVTGAPCLLWGFRHSSVRRPAT